MAKKKGLFKTLKKQVRLLLASPEERRHALVGSTRHMEEKRQFQIAFLKGVGLEPQHTVLDIGCGTLRGGIPLIEFLEEGNYCGMEARANVLDEGRKELADNGLAHKKPTLVCSQTFDVDVEMTFNYAWAFSVLFHMNDEILGKCLPFVSAHLKPEGVFYANVNLDDGKEGQWQGFPVVHRSLEFYTDQAKTAGLTCELMGTIAEFGHVTNHRKEDEQSMLRFAKA